ncbi:26S proteasome non-ATPase regulatory subunit 10-like [Argopecten irradians]|uniref:26S proteasome non-ATPase regulatory subunit 10-like n=1 Tax=Argopecten irradians TaxID=31199 RepID=UPI003711028B
MAGDDVCKLAYDGQVEILKQKLRDNNELATKMDETNRMPLHWAASAGHLQIVECLFRYNVPIDARDESNWTALMIASSAGRDQIVSLLLGAGAQVNAVNQTGQCSLHYAASKNRYEFDHFRHLACEEERTEVALLLVGHGAQIELLNKEEKSPLDLAKPGLQRSLQNASRT